MSESLEKLFHAESLKEFAPLFQEAVKQYKDPKAFVTAAADYLPLRLYEHYYQDSAPHSFFGLIAALWASQSLFSKETHWRPVAQQSWFATREKKRNPLPLEKVEGRTEGDEETRWASFRTSADAGDFQQAAAWAKGFLAKESSRSFFRLRTLSHAMEDSFLGGHKAVYLHQAWKLAEALDWNGAEKVLAPALHLLVLGQRDTALHEQIRGDLSAFSFGQGNGGISDGAYEELEQALLFSDDAQSAVKALQSLSSSGSSLETAQQSLLIAAAQALCNSRPAQWIWPMRAFHFIQLAAPGRLDSSQQIPALVMGAAHLQRASARTRELEGNRSMDGLTHKMVPVEPLALLKSVVSHTDPYASAIAVRAALSMGESGQAALLETLSGLAVKNDGEVCRGHDLLFIYELADAFKRSQHPQKDKLPVAAGFFLGRVPKVYELFGTLKDI